MHYCEANLLNPMLTRVLPSTVSQVPAAGVPMPDHQPAPPALPGDRLWLRLLASASAEGQPLLLSDRH